MAKGPDYAAYLTELANELFKQYTISVVAVFGDVDEHASKPLLACTPNEVLQPQDAQSGFHVSELCRRGLHTTIVIRESEDPALLDSVFAQRHGIRTAAFVRLDFEGKSLVVVFGFPGAEIADAETVFREYASRFALAHRYGAWPINLATVSHLIHELIYPLRTGPNRDEVIRQSSELLRHAIPTWRQKSTFTIWLRRHLRRRLECVKVHSIGAALSREVLAIGEGLIGWVAEHNEPICVHPKDEQARLHDGTRVVDQYVSLWDGNDETEQEIVVPMEYRGRRVGVLNVEFTEAEAVPQDLLPTVRAVATLAAQALHEMEMDELGVGVLKVQRLDDLRDLFIERAANVLESPLASVFAWNTADQCLKYVIGCNRIIERGQKYELLPGDKCYTEPAVGLTRWVVENSLPLMVTNLAAFRDMEHPGHDRQIEEFAKRAQIELQRLHGSDTLELQEVDAPGDCRRCWQYLIRVGDRLESRCLWQPAWSGTQVESTNNEDGEEAAGGTLIVPIADGAGRLHAEGALRFSRKADEPPFTEDDLALAQRIASQLAPPFSSTKLKETYAAERRMMQQVVNSKPGHVEEEFQERLQERLRAIKDVVGADLILVRSLEGVDLHLVANYPLEAELQAGHDAAGFAIPKIARVGKGGSGRAAENRQPVYMANESDPQIQNMRHEHDGRETAGFVSRIKSEAAIPLLNDDRVVGSITAISFDDSWHRVDYVEGRCKGRFGGIQQWSVNVLQFHSNWMARALEAITRIVHRQRSQFALSVAVQELTKSIERDDFHPADFFLAGLVIATHHDGLRFHQAFIADRESSGGPGVVRPTKTMREFTQGAGWASAWGCANLEEQNGALNGRRGLEADIEATRPNANACRTLQDKWAAVAAMSDDFRSDEPLILSRSCAASGRKDERVEYGPAVQPLLDAFCGVFEIPENDAAWDKMQVGVVPLYTERAISPSRRTLMFVTNVRFLPELEGRFDVRTIPYDLLQGLDQIGRVFTLAQVACERNLMAGIVDPLRNGLFETIKRLLLPIRGLEKLAEKLIAASPGSVPDSSISRQRRLFRLIWKFVDAKRRSLQITESGDASQYEGFQRSSATIRLENLLDDLLKDFAVYAEESGFKFYWDVDEEVSEQEVEGDVALLETMFVILLQNAAEAAESHSDTPREVRFKATLHGDAAVSFQVSDTGQPFPNPSERREWYKRPVRSVWYGLGLGLLAAKRIADSHRGDLRDDGQKTFEVRLPLATPVGDASNS